MANSNSPWSWTEAVMHQLAHTLCWLKVSWT